MISNLPAPYRRPTGLLPSRTVRAARAEVEVVQAGAAIEAARVEAVAAVTQHALMATAQLSAVEALLIQRVPHAERRLGHIADAGAAGIANVVLRMGL